MSERQYHLKFDGSAAASVDAYVEYKRIVGDDDGGTVFTPEQYEEYKKRIAPARLENRLYVSWTSPSGMDCKLIGPETDCFCEHKYRQHKTDFSKLPTTRPILLPCKVRGCPCKSYHYIPVCGSQRVRCSCKHTTEDHHKTQPHKCQKLGCGCSGFSSTYTCGCGAPAHAHSMIVETSEERESRGHPLGRPTMYQAMGGITGFSSLMEGYMRLDPSGAGAPPLEFLDQEITSSDHPFLRANVKSIRAHKQAIGAPQNVIDGNLTEMMSAMKRPGEDDMDYYERRYQERIKAERAAKRAVRPPKPTKRVTPSTGVNERSPGPAPSISGVKMAPSSRSKRPNDKKT